MLRVLREGKGCSHVKGAAGRERVLPYVKGAAGRERVLPCYGCCGKEKGAPMLRVLREGKGCFHVKGAAEAKGKGAPMLTLPMLRLLSSKAQRSLKTM